MKEILSIDGCTLTIEDVIAVSRGDTKVDVSEKAKTNVFKCREYIDSLLSSIDDGNKGNAIYGVTTGFGDLVSQKISPDELEQLQENLIRSHCSGTGNVFPDSVILGAMVLRMNSLARGNSGISPEVLQLLRDFINNRIIPFVPSQGSLGASGDLCPLAHVALSLIGEGTVKVSDNEYKPTGEVMNQHSLKPAKLKAKEGLALLNGSQFIASLACHNVIDGENLLKIADIALSMSLEALAGTLAAFDDRINDLRPYRGSFVTASNVQKITEESELLNPDRIQDAYSLRCAPQIHGTARDTYNFIRSMVEIEVNSVTDNPLIFPDDDTILSGGNFHGQPLAMTLDLSAIVLTNIANVSERRIERLVNNKLSKHLPPFLTSNPGLNSGLMICHYTAASLVSENRTFSHPASVDSIPVSAAQEDVVSMGTIAGRKAMTIVENTFNVLSIELLAAAQALDFADVSQAGVGTRAAHDFIRSFIPTLEEDRVFHNDIAKISESLKSSEFVDAVEKSIGKLK